MKVSDGVCMLKISRKYSFTGALKTHVSLIQLFFKIIKENIKSIKRDLCNTQTLKFAHQLLKSKVTDEIKMISLI